MNISQRIDRLPVTNMLWRVLMLTGIGWLFDAMDQGMVAGVMAAIGKEWSLSPSQLGMLGSAAAIGMALGAAFAGMYSDRWGRKGVILFTLVLYGIASALSGLAAGFTMLLIFRFFTGLGLGGELPAASTLVSEFSPVKYRGRMVVLLESFWAWGWILAALIAYLVIPVYSWRIAFFIGAVPAVYAAYLRKSVPESPRYLEQKEQLEKAHEIVSKMEQEAGVEIPKLIKPKNNSAINRASLTQLWSSQYWRRTFVLWILWLGINFGYYGFVLWIPTLMVGKGFVLIKSLQFTLIMTLAQLPGYYSAALLIEKLGRKSVLVIYLAGTAIAAYFFGQSITISQILLYGCFLYFFSLGAWGAVYAYTPELYPTPVRGSGSGWAAAIGRIGMIAAPYVVGIVYESYGKELGYNYVFGLLAIVFAIVALIVGVLGIETKGKTLDELN